MESIEAAVPHIPICGDVKSKSNDVGFYETIKKKQVEDPH